MTTIVPGDLCIIKPDFFQGYPDPQIIVATSQQGGLDVVYLFPLMCWTMAVGVSSVST